MPPPRLSALDASFLYLEQPSTPMHVGVGGDLPRPASGFDYDRLVELIEQRHRAGAALPAEGAPRARATSPGRSGSTTPTSTSPTTSAARRCPGPGRPTAAHRAGRPADVAAARPRPPAVGDVPRRGARPTAASRCSPRPTRRWSTASATIDIGQVHPRRRRRSPARCRRSCGCRGPSRRTPDSSWTRWPRRSPGPARWSTSVRATAGDALAVAAAARPRGRLAWSATVVTGGTAGARIPAQRRDLHAAPVRRRPRRPRRRTGKCAPRTGAR